MEHDWRDRDEKESDADEEDEEPAAWRPEGTADEEEVPGAKAKKPKSNVSDWRTGGFEQIAASKSRNAAWEPEEEEKSAPVVTAPVGGNAGSRGEQTGCGRYLGPAESSSGRTCCPRSFERKARDGNGNCCGRGQGETLKRAKARGEETGKRFVVFCFVQPMGRRDSKGQPAGFGLGRSGDKSTRDAEEWNGKRVRCEPGNKGGDRGSRAAASNGRGDSRGSRASNGKRRIRIGDGAFHRRKQFLRKR